MFWASTEEEEEEWQKFDSSKNDIEGEIAKEEITKVTKIKSVSEDSDSFISRPSAPHNTNDYLLYEQRYSCVGT